MMWRHGTPCALVYWQEHHLRMHTLPAAGSHTRSPKPTARCKSSFTTHSGSAVGGAVTGFLHKEVGHGLAWFDMWRVIRDVVLAE